MAKESAGLPPISVTPDQEKSDKPSSRHAPLYRVLLHNDDVTTMDFVIELLRKVFHKSEQESIRIMLLAHHAGIAHVATMPLEQAEFRVDQSHSLASAQKFPLKLTYEPEQ
jgi:ATP-dependent Clp protease adaptor protein ClpS